uniref:Sideroflexin 2 n=1 Tax=Hucho hucho TaxID=62062 RepID=A0A4W5M1Y4_9TELE
IHSHLPPYAPRWDQSTFMGRLKHFVNITDWRTALLPDSRLDESKNLGYVWFSCSRALHYAKKLYDSAFHPDTGNRMNLIGRMSFQVPGEMAITGGMLQFYRPHTHSYAECNVMHMENIKSYLNVLHSISLLSLFSQIGVAYLTATSTALATAAALNLYTKVQFDAQTHTHTHWFD